MKRSKVMILTIAGMTASGCVPPYVVSTTNPSKSYADTIMGRYEQDPRSRAKVRFASDELAPPSQTEQTLQIPETEMIAPPPPVNYIPASARNTRDYQGPLSVGEPGVGASLWRESRAGTDLFRDSRAYQPMDLITIVISENAEGRKQANTEVKQSSTLEAAVSKLFGLESIGTSAGQNKIDPTALLNATTKNDFKGEGTTNRRDSLTGRISAMVVEVLPSGILRVEGQKIISLNSEEQVMVISGLVRTRDISSENEVDSSKIANVRIDYYGRGALGEAQHGGWFSRFVRSIWPF